MVPPRPTDTMLRTDRLPLSESAPLHDTLSLTLDSPRLPRGFLPDPLQDPQLAALPQRTGFKLLDGCAIYSSLGRGGMGSVYRARDLAGEIDVAIKCLHPGCSRPAEARARFERETQVGAQLDHPNVVQVLRGGESHGVRFLVMEYVHGETLRERVQRRGASSLGEAIGITQRAARGLAAAHQGGLIHRDIKPANLMLGTAGEVKVCDLGLAKLQGSDVALTLDRSVLGSPRYMAPEQWRDGRRAGPAADVFGLGATLYFLLAGEDGNQGKHLREIQEDTEQRGFPDLRLCNREVPAEVAQVVARAVERDPARRYADCASLARALDTLAIGRETTLLHAGNETRGALKQRLRPAPESLTTLGPGDFLR
ncbi:MAG: serine/threonine protein kinase [Planctomycetota bacterium]|jgi:serine/threonine protein kinase